MSIIDDIGTAVRTASEAVGPSIVGIGRDGRGSGVVIADGQVLTNAHNLRGGEVTVRFADGRSTPGTVTGVDGDGDLAVVSVDTAGARAIDWGAGDNLTIGAPVFGAAATVGGGVRVTFGLVSSVSRSFRGPGGRRIAGSVEHTAPMAPGSSGGAIVNSAGKFLGLNTNRIGEGFYLALPADAALKTRVEALGRGESAERPRLGVAIAPSHVARRLRRSVGLADREGILVRGVEDGSLADAAGVEAGDLIVSAGGSPVRDADDLHEALGTLKAPFELGLVRGAEDRTVTVAAGAVPVAAGPVEPGAEPQERTPGDA